MAFVMAAAVRLSTIICALALAVSVVASANAQTPLMQIGKSYPPVYLKLCQVDDASENDLLQVARRNADLAARLGKQASVTMQDILDTREPHCYFHRFSGTLIRLEPSIEPFPAWHMSYEPTGPDICRQAPEIRCAPKLQLTRYYWVSFHGPHGDGLGLLEVPERPYLLDYLRDPNRAR